MNNKITHSLIVGFVLSVSVLLLAFSSGPPDGRTDAPGESNCTQCHSSFALNSGPGTLSLAGSQSMYLPGDTITLNIDISHSGQMRWGFEITALDASNNPAGELLVDDAVNTQKSTAGSGREYVKHNSTGTYAGTADASLGWTVKWVANNSVTGTVTFYLAGNAADFNGANSNDFIYTQTLQIIEDPNPPACCVNLTGNVDNDPGDNIDIGDITALIDFLFISGTVPVCFEEANCDGDPAGNVDIGDLTALIDFLFISGTLPAPCLTP